MKMRNRRQSENVVDLRNPSRVDTAMQEATSFLSAFMYSLNDLFGLHDSKTIQGIGGENVENLAEQIRSLSQTRNIGAPGLTRARGE